MKLVSVGSQHVVALLPIMPHIAAGGDKLYGSAGVIEHNPSRVQARETLYTVCTR